MVCLGESVQENIYVMLLHFRMEWNRGMIYSHCALILHWNKLCRQESQSESERSGIEWPKSRVYLFTPIV
jgi:hypothetical protein